MNSINIIFLLLVKLSLSNGKCSALLYLTTFDSFCYKFYKKTY